MRLKDQADKCDLQQMYRSLALVLCVVVSGCQRPPQREPRVSEAEIRQLHADAPGMTDECLNKIRWGGLEALTGVEECYKFDPPRRWRGIYFGAFEQSRFCPAPAIECSYDTPGETIWLKPGPSMTIPRYNGEATSVLFEIDFVGRKTSYRGNYGHLGGSDQEIIIDRLISMKRLEEPPRRRGT